MYRDTLASFYGMALSEPLEYRASSCLIAVRLMQGLPGGVIGFNMLH